MKISNIKSLIVVAAVLVISGFATDSAFAQRHGGGGRSSAPTSRGSSGGARISHSTPPSRGNSAGISRSSNRSTNTGIRSSNRPGAFQGNHGQAINRGGNRTVQRRSVGGVYTRGNRGTNFGRRGYSGRLGYGAYRRTYHGGYYNYYRPYLGFGLSVLPFGYYPFFYGDVQFYYSGGLFYRQYDTEYKVVVPPVGAEVPSIPSEAQQVTVNGQTYFEYKGVYYNSVQNAEGKTVYVIAGKDGILNTDDGAINADQGIKMGDIVNELPDGVREVMLKGERFYVSEDGIYYQEIRSGNTVTYKVVGL